MGMSQYNIPIFYICASVLVIDQADAYQKLHSHGLIAGPGSHMCANRLSDHPNADLCTDGKSRLSHDISCLIVHSFVHRILIIGRDARNFLLSGCISTFMMYSDNSYMYAM